MSRKRVAGAILTATLVVGWPLLLPWVYDTHDGHYALYNAAQFDRALREGQIPVRWLPDLFGGRGLPHFLFYHPLAFYLLSALHLTGLGFIPAVKLLYLLSLALSGLAMYRWLADLLPAEASLLGAMAYVLAPYRAVEIHVKGDPPAALAFVFIPLVLLAIRRAAAGARGGVPALGLASAGLVLSHSVTALIAFPAFALYAALEIRRPFLGPCSRLSAGALLGALLSAFYWLPAIVERSLVRVESRQGILAFDFREHFLAAWQWLSPLWGYHGSFPGTRDDMSFQIGPVHVAGIVAGLLLWRGYKTRSIRRLAAWAAVVTAAALVGTLTISRPVWEAIGPLRLVQFPWRLLAVVAVGSAVLLALAASRMRGPGLVAAAALAPPGITLAFAAVTGNRLYWLVTGVYAAAGVAALALWRARGRRELLVPVVGGLLCTTALPWTAVPLHALVKGEPAIIPITERDLSPERVRLGIRRTTARDDYLPRTVRDVPPRDPAQEYFPPPGAEPPPDVLASTPAARISGVRRTSSSFAFTADSAGPVVLTLNLHDFPGWRARIGDGPADAGRPLAHRHDAEGRVVLDLPAGRHRVELRFGRTPPRRWADGLSLAGFAILLAWGLSAAVRLRR